MSRITDEYRTVAGRVGWLERRSRGRLSFTGRDAASFLHALVTNEINALGSGCGAYAAYLTPQGRMITDLTIHRREHDLLVDTGTSDAAELAARFDQLLFSEDVQVADVTATTAHLTVIGATAAAVLGHAFSVVPVSPDVLSTLPMLSHALAGDAIVVRTDEVALPSFDVFLPASALPTAVVRLGELGAAQISDELFDALRIEHGHAVFGVDMTTETIPLEAGLLERAINTSKGCYVGQEIIVRILHRAGGRVAKRLVRLAFDEMVTEPPAAGTPLLDGDHEIGRLTSAAVNPTSGHVIALGYVHRDSAQEGKVLCARAGEREHRVTITGFAR